MPKVKFLRKYKVNDEEGREYAEGEIVDLSEGSAKHFIDREAAEEYSEEAKPKPSPKSKVPKTDDA